MASVDQPFQTSDEQQTNQSTSNSSVGQAPQPQVTSGSGSIGGGAGSMGSPGGVSAPAQQNAAPANPAGTNSGSYPNLSKYLQANSGWNSGQGGLGGEIASNLNQQGNQVQQSVQNANNAFQNQGNTWQQNTNQANQSFQQGLSNPYAYEQNTPNAQQQANTALNAQYTGAQNLNSVNQNLGQQVQNYNTTAQQGQTEAGRYNLLQQMFGNSNYNQGQQSLDQALLESSPSQLGQLQGAQQQAAQTNLNYQNANTSAQNQADAWQNYAQGVQQQARGALNTAIGNEGQNIQNEFQNAQTQQQTQLAALQSQLTNPSTASYGNYVAAPGNVQLSQQEINNLGLQSLVGQNLYGTQIGQYLTPQNLTAQNTATQGDYNTLAALQQLSGNPSTLTNASSQLLSQYQNQPGTLYNANNDITANLTGLNAGIAANQEAYNSNITTPYTWLGQNKVNDINQNLLTYVGNQQGGNIITNTPSGTGDTFAQLGGNASTLVNPNTPGESVFLDWAKSQGATPTSSLSPAQQAQINSLQGLIASDKTLGGEQQVISGLQNQINQIQASPQDTALNQSFLNQYGPMQFYESLLSGKGPETFKQYDQQVAGNSNQYAALDALQSYLTNISRYAPNQTLQVAPPTPTTGGTS